MLLARNISWNTLYCFNLKRHLSTARCYHSACCLCLDNLVLDNSGYGVFVDSFSFE